MKYIKNVLLNVLLNMFYKNKVDVTYPHYYKCHYIINYETQ